MVIIHVCLKYSDFNFFLLPDHILYSKCGNYIWVSGIYGHCSVDGKMLTIEDVTRNALQHLQGEISPHGTVHRVRKQVSLPLHTYVSSSKISIWGLFDLKMYQFGEGEGV